MNEKKEILQDKQELLMEIQKVDHKILHLLYLQFHYMDHQQMHQKLLQVIEQEILKDSSFLQLLLKLIEGNIEFHEVDKIYL